MIATLTLISVINEWQMERKLKGLKPGDVIRFYRDEHWAIYIETMAANEKSNEKSVIHWWTNGDTEEPRIRIDPFRRVKGNLCFEKKEINSFGINMNHTNQMVEKAREFKSRVDKLEDERKKYNRLFKDSEHFVRWCHGRLKCIDFEEIKTMMDPWEFVNGQRSKNREVLAKLKPGDLIKFVTNSSNHWAVYTGVKNGDSRFIHWTGDDHVTEPNRTCLKILSKGTLEEANKLENLNKDMFEDTITNGAEVVERVQAFEAKIRAGEESGEDFSDLFRNCQEFANWCRYRLGPKALKISKEQIEKIEDIRNFVRGEFSVIPCQIDSHEDIPVSKMRKLKKDETDISSSLQ